MNKLNFRIQGEGDKTILFLHGWGGNKNSFDNLICNLMYDFKVITVDLYGFGESVLPDTIHDIYSYALELYLNLKELDLKNFSIVAHSFGGRLALILASLFDLEIDKLVLIGCAGIKPKKNLKVNFKIYSYKLLKFFNNKKLIKVDLNKFGSSDYKELTDHKKSLFVNVVNEDLKWLLKNILNKTLIINGEKDTSTPVYMAKVLNKNIANSVLDIINKTGHFCYLESTYLVTNKIKSFILNNNL